MMPLARTGYADTFARDNLPPAAQWPLLEFTSDLLKYPERLNAAAEIIDVPTAVYGADRPALKTQDGAVWTYGELRARANQIARVLTEDLGLVTGNRVLLRAPNNPWTVAAWLGVIKAGGIVVTTMAALRARELAPIVAKTRPSIALVDHRHADDVRLVADSTAPGLRIVAYGGDGADDLTRLIRGKAGDFAAADTAADDVALFGPTSGSTGVPKITTHFHRDLLSIDNTFGKMTLRLRPADLVACTAPFAFTFGLGMLVVFTLRAGACAFLTETATPAQLADMVAEHQVTVLATAPTAYRQILRDGKAGCPGCAPRSAPASTSRARPGSGCGTTWDCGSSTASARPRCCTSSSARPTTTSGREPPASRSPATGPPSSTPTATRPPRASRGGWR